MAGEAQINPAIALLDAWLDTMRGPDGYGGPVVHWWQDCLLFTGAGLDWRYEGIIIGYLNLYQRTGDERWLAKARQAGDDLVQGQLPTGNFRNSSFELNPYPGGTPHEAACDLALLHLARVLKEQENPAWQTYAATAEHNLQAYIIGVLWDKARQVFRNTIGDASFAPNKAATIIETLFAWATVLGDNRPVLRYGLPTLEAVVECQVRAPGSPLDGAIPQSVAGQGKGRRFFPFYIARCIPALVQAYAAFGDARYVRAAKSAVAFILRYRLPNGSFPQVIYGDGRVNRYPQWIAGVGDVLRAMDLLEREGMDVAADAALRWLLDGLQASGGLRPAHGFASQVSQKQPPHLPEFRDVLGVCGWADKAFRYLTGRVTSLPAEETPRGGMAEQSCVFRGRMATYREDERVIELRVGQEVIYRWRKGEPWAEVCWGQA